MVFADYQRKALLYSLYIAAKYEKHFIAKYAMLLQNQIRLLTINNVVERPKDERQSIQ